MEMSIASVVTFLTIGLFLLDSLTSAVLTGPQFRQQLNSKKNWEKLGFDGPLPQDSVTDQGELKANTAPIQYTIPKTDKKVKALFEDGHLYFEHDSNCHRLVAVHNRREGEIYVLNMENKKGYDIDLKLVPSWKDQQGFQLYHLDVDLPIEAWDQYKSGKYLKL